MRTFRKFRDGHFCRHDTCTRATVAVYYGITAQCIVLDFCMSQIFVLEIFSYSTASYEIKVVRTIAKRNFGNEKGQITVHQAHILLVYIASKACGKNLHHDGRFNCLCATVNVSFPALMYSSEFEPLLFVKLTVDREPYNAENVFSLALLKGSTVVRAVPVSMQAKSLQPRGPGRNVLAERSYTKESTGKTSYIRFTSRFTII